MLNMIIFGAPGCGKGTQSKLIVDKYKLTHLSTGDLLRSEISSNTELGVIAEKYITKGNLVPDEMIIEILKKAIDNRPDKSNGIILDGFPRTVAQAVALEEMLKNRDMSTVVLIDLHVDNHELISRLLYRGETSGRCDDNLETIKNRLEVYISNTVPVCNFYQNLNKYKAIDGMGTIEEIFNRITLVLARCT
ncbi:MAG: adenylate kinase [Paludibacter sp.]|nr:adenylate kinase [Paludibacter sp.]